MKKGIIAWLTLCALMLSVLCSCTNDTTEKSSQSEDNSATSTASADTSADDEQSKVTLTEGRTIFIYMCGSNLVTKQGLAGKNIDELLKAEVGDNLHIIIQTGGTKTWRSHDISESEAQCYEVKDGGKLSEIPLDGKEYQYVFVVTDIFGNTFTSDIATFEMTKSYDELLKNPLPDETFAAKVTNIEPYSTTE